MIHEVGVNLQAQLGSKGCPFVVIDGPEFRTTATFARERIVIEHDDNGDSFGARRQADLNPRTRLTRQIGVKVTIYAKSPSAGGIYWEHQRRAAQVLDMVLIGLDVIAKQRQNLVVFKSGKFVYPEDLKHGETPGGAVYELKLTFDRGVADRNWDGTGLPTATVVRATSSTPGQFTIAPPGILRAALDRDLVAWLNPGFSGNPFANFGHAPGDFTPGTPNQVPGQGAAPTYSPTALGTNRPGLVFDATQKQTLKLPLGNLWRGPGLFPCTVMAVISPGLPFTKSGSDTDIKTVIATGTSVGGNSNPGTLIDYANGATLGSEANHVFFDAGYFDDTGTANEMSDSTPRPTGVYVVTQVVDAGNLHIRVNGTQVATIAITATSSFTCDQLVLGAENDSFQNTSDINYFSGALGQVILVARALNDADLALYEGALMNP